MNRKFYTALLATPVVLSLVLAPVGTALGADKNSNGANARQRLTDEQKKEDAARAVEKAAAEKAAAQQAAAAAAAAKQAEAERVAAAVASLQRAAAEKAAVEKAAAEQAAQAQADAARRAQEIGRAHV